MYPRRCRLAVRRWRHAPQRRRNSDLPLPPCVDLFSSLSAIMSTAIQSAARTRWTALSYGCAIAGPSARRTRFENPGHLSGSRRRSSVSQRRHLTSNRPLVVLGLESSADDSCCAIVDSSRRILANVVVKQHSLNARFGGIHPMHAQAAHEAGVVSCPSPRDLFSNAPGHQRRSQLPCAGPAWLSRS